MPKVYKLDGVTPVVDPTAYVHPTAVLTGDVVIGADCYVGPGASLRGDFGRVVMKRGGSFQDNCIGHTFAGRELVIGVDCNIGHGAVPIMFLIGTEMDYVDQNLGANFVFRNPNETSRCGCGESFSV